MGVKVTGLQTSIGFTVRASQRLGKEIPGIMELLGKAIVDSAKERAPVDTGFLRSTIDVFGEVENGIVLGASANYALFVEMGTSRTPPQPFMQPAIDLWKKTVSQALKRKVFSRN